METILIAGIDGVVGANFAASLSTRHPVVGIAFQEATQISGCAVECCSSSAADAVWRTIQRVSPQRVVYCGPGAQSCWESHIDASPRELERAAAWQDAAQRCGAHWTLISSDGVFTGPWMFHAENSQSLCSSNEAATLRQIEELTATQQPEALIVRTHAFGWRPGSEASRTGWLEQLIDWLDRGAGCPWDGVRHASPILATDLVEVVQKAWQSGLAGVYHIAGAERVNPVQFARRIAHEFAIPFLHSGASESLTNRATGFGRGETSLQTRKVRRALGIGLPLLAEGIQRLYEQHQNGYRARLQGTEATSRMRVA